MSKFSKIFAGIGILIAVVGLGVLVGYWASSSGPSTPTATSNPATTQESGSRVANANRDPGKTDQPKPPIPTSDTNSTRKTRLTNIVPGPGPVATNQVPDWEEKVDAILTADNDTDSDKAKKLLELFPLLTGDAQEEVAHHLSNIIPDEDYAAFGQYLTNSTLSEDVLDILLEDVLNRPNSIKLPMLLEVARDSQNPKSAEAKDVLELFLEQDYGNDWAKWQAETTKWLKDNPD